MTRQIDTNERISEQQNVSKALVKQVIAIWIIPIRSFGTQLTELIYEYVSQRPSFLSEEVAFRTTSLIFMSQLKMRMTASIVIDQRFLTYRFA